jgi:hypothetical protein
MLSTAYRLRLEAICECIANTKDVSLEDRIWATKLGEVNRTAATMLRQARRKAQTPEMPKDGIDDFLNQLDIGDVNKPEGITGFNGPEDIVEFFRHDRPNDWRQRD